MLSIIIPTLNAGTVLGTTLAALSTANAIAYEIIVADGGSIDDTAAVAIDGDAIFLETVRGRGRQMGAAAAAAAGDWLLFLHADTRPTPGWAQAVAAFISDPGNCHVAGYFDLTLDDDTWAARHLERLIRLRNVLFGLPHGDQGLLIHRSFYDRLGGYRSVPLLEDVDLARRIGRRRLHPIGATVITSAEKYRRDGYLMRPLLNCCLLALYAAGVSPRRLSRLQR
ncbi:MAG: TIGR04283 family arsenosugar biosynthesis glycosyltransferase [Rhodospirillales bacterium]|nr:TIGR04283 family arsenosugar biosynthesis glycosyltransferase [Rhodospirillales bacterium]